MAQYDDLPIQRIIVVGLLSIAITIITVLGVQVLYFGMLGYVDEGKLASSTYRESVEVLSGQSKQISLFGVDEATGRITIPIDEAMKKLVASAAKPESNEKKSSSTDET
jgi:hypothetical protein